MQEVRLANLDHAGLGQEPQQECADLVAGANGPLDPVDAGVLGLQLHDGHAVPLALGQAPAQVADQGEVQFGRSLLDLCENKLGVDRLANLVPDRAICRRLTRVHAHVECSADSDEGDGVQVQAFEQADVGSPHARLAGTRGHLLTDCLGDGQHVLAQHLLGIRILVCTACFLSSGDHRLGAFDPAVVHLGFDLFLRKQFHELEVRFVLVSSDA